MIYTPFESLTLVTAASATPVSVAEAKSHLNVDTSDDDNYIGSIVNAATNEAEIITGKKFVSQVWDVVYDSFLLEIVLPHLPVISVDQIIYIDGDGTEQQLYSYQADTSSNHGRIQPTFGEYFPATRSGIYNAVTITFTCGFGDASDVPAEIKQAILLRVGDFYAHRETVIVGTISTQLPMAAKHLLAMHSIQI